MQSEDLVQSMTKADTMFSRDNFDLICHRAATWRHHQKDGCITHIMRWLLHGGSTCIAEFLIRASQVPPEYPKHQTAQI